MGTGPDLPAGVWFDILRYLSRTALMGMMGLNRVLFELAMDELYQEVRLVSDDKETRKVLHQLRYVSVAKRVRRLIVRPDWLPEEDCSDALSVGQTIPRGVASLRRRLLDLGRFGPSTNLFYDASIALKQCSKLREVSVILHNHRLTPSFAMFLGSLWKPDSIGPNITKLYIEGTSFNIPHIVNPLIKAQKALALLDDFSLVITPSRIEHIRSPSLLGRGAMFSAMKSFLNDFRTRLVSLSMSSPLIADVGELIKPDLLFPKLQRFEVHTTFFNHPSSLARLGLFLHMHAGTLEHLVIRPTSAFVPNHRSQGYVYCWWLLQEGNEEDCVSFSRLVFPVMHTLDIGVLNTWLPDEHLIYAELHDSDVLPVLRKLSPKLTSLALRGVALTYVRVNVIIQGIAGYYGNWTLQTLDLRVEVLCPRIFNVIFHLLKCLNFLTIEYEQIAGDESPDFGRQNISHMSHFVKVMRDRHYSHWTLKRLRITSKQLQPNCAEPHPALEVMVAVVRTLWTAAKPVKIDCNFTCVCDEALAAESTLVPFHSDAQTDIEDGSS